MTNRCHSKYWPFACISLSLLFSSCQKDIEEGISPKPSSSVRSQAIEERGLTPSDTSGLGAIVPISDSPLKKFLNQKQTPRLASTQATNDLSASTLYDIANFPINLIVKENSTGSQFLTSQGVNNVLTFSSENTGDLNQRFSLSFLPLTGYAIIKTADDKLVSAGQYTNQPGVNILYVKGDNTTTGASWNFLDGQVTSGSFIIQNADVLGYDGPEPTFGNVYYKVIGSQSNGIYFDKYRNQAKQEFEIRLLDDFEVQSVEYINDETATVAKIPDYVVDWQYTNGSSIQQSITTAFGTRASETSTFSSKNSFTARVSTAIKVKVPFIADGKITTDITGSTESTYGTSETFEDTRNYNIPLLVPANTRITATASIARYQMDVNYIATLRGKNTGKIIKVAGVWNGVDCTSITVDVQQINLRTNAIKRMPTVKVVANNNQ